MPVATGRALPRGTALDGFEIVEAVAEHPAGIDYHARDVAGDATVLLTEYLPARLARREADGSVVPLAPALAPAWQRGLAAFVAETQALQRCRHAALPPVLGCGEGRGTAWRAVPLADGEPLSVVRAARGRAFDATELRRLLETLLDALAAWHREAGLHGAISATTVRLRADGQVLLLPPGGADQAVAATASAADRIAALLASAEPSFAPAEQIAPTADLPLGPSADLYALAGVARYCITGRLPPPALERGGPGEPLADEVQRLQREHLAPRYDEPLLAALAAALAPRPADRPQDVAEFRARLAAPPLPGDADADAASAAPTAAPPPWHARAPRRPALMVGGGVLAALVLAAVLWTPTGPAAPDSTAVRGDIGAPVVAAPPPAVASAVVSIPAYVPPAPVAAKAPGRVATSPREACSRSTAAALPRCMKSRCAQSQWKLHPQCEQLRLTGKVD
jgi:hypothetical protein